MWTIKQDQIKTNPALIHIYASVCIFWVPVCMYWRPHCTILSDIYNKATVSLVLLYVLANMFRKKYTIGKMLLQTMGDDISTMGRLDTGITINSVMKASLICMVFQWPLVNIHEFITGFTYRYILYKVQDSSRSTSCQLPITGPLHVDRSVQHVDKSRYCTDVF